MRLAIEILRNPTNFSFLVNQYESNQYELSLKELTLLAITLAIVITPLKYLDRLILSTEEENATSLPAYSELMVTSSRLTTPMIGPLALPPKELLLHVIPSQLLQVSPLTTPYIMQPIKMLLECMDISILSALVYRVQLWALQNLNSQSWVFRAARKNFKLMKITILANIPLYLLSNSILPELAPQNIIHIYIIINFGILLFSKLENLIVPRKIENKIGEVKFFKSEPEKSLPVNFYLEPNLRDFFHLFDDLIRSSRRCYHHLSLFDKQNANAAKQHYLAVHNDLKKAYQSISTVFGKLNTLGKDFPDTKHFNVTLEKNAVNLSQWEMTCRDCKKWVEDNRITPSPTAIRSLLNNLRQILTAIDKKEKQYAQLPKFNSTSYPTIRNARA